MKLQKFFAVSLCAAIVLFAAIEPATAYSADDSSRLRRGSKQDKPEVLFPEATRVETEERSSRLAAKVQKVFALYEKEKHAEAIVAAEALASDKKAGAFEKSQAYYIAGFAAEQLDGDSYERALGYFEKALAADGLSNNTHYQTMLQMAQMLAEEERNPEALKYLDRFLAETKQHKPEVLSNKANVLVRMERYPEAIEILKGLIGSAEKPDNMMQQLLMAAYIETDQPLLAAEVAEAIVKNKPDDKRAMLNLVSIYLQADQPEKAGQAFDRMRAANMLTESKDYENAYRLLANIDGREKDAIAVINEGLGKNVLQPSHEVYNFLGQSYYFSEQVDQAIAAWQKAAPLAKDGETYLNLAKVLIQEGRWQEGKTAATQAIGKGVKKMGDAWMAVARAEYGEDGKNRAQVLAAYKEAAKYPETKAQATKAIAQMSR